VLAEALERGPLAAGQAAVVREREDALDRDGDERRHHEADVLAARREQVRDQHVDDEDVEQCPALEHGDALVTPRGDAAHEAEHHEAAEDGDRPEHPTADEAPRRVGDLTDQPGQQRDAGEQLERAEEELVVDEEDRLMARHVLRERPPRHGHRVADHREEHEHVDADGRSEEGRHARQHEDEQGDGERLGGPHERDGAHHEREGEDGEVDVAGP
jgi:hypothetical protein